MFPAFLISVSYSSNEEIILATLLPSLEDTSFAIFLSVHLSLCGVELNTTETALLKTISCTINEYWERDSNPVWKAKKDEEESLVELQLAEMNVVKHLGYSKDRLKEMWDWRQSNGVKYKEHDFQKDDFRILFEKRWDWSEINTFCENI